MNRESKTAHRVAFTLVELLVSLALAAFIVAITGQLAVQAVITRERVSDDVARERRRQTVWRTLSQDMNSILPEAATDGTVMNVFGAPNQVLELHVLSVVPSPNDGLHAVRLPATARYRLVQDPIDSKKQSLVREATDLTQSSSPASWQTVSHGIRSFEVQVLANNIWTDRVKRNDDGDANIEAVRLAIKWEGDERPQVRTYVLKEPEDASVE